MHLLTALAAIMASFRKRFLFPDVFLWNAFAAAAVAPPARAGAYYRRTSCDCDKRCTRSLGHHDCMSWIEHGNVMCELAHALLATMKTLQL